MATPDALDRGRKLFTRQAWREACEELTTADRAGPLGPEDLERLAMAAYLVGRDAESADAWARAHYEYLERGATARAARCAFWLAFGLLNRGERARGGGWIARARRLLDDHPHECVEQGYLLLPLALRHISEGDNEGAYRTFGQAVEIGERFRDPDLVALGRHGRGRALIRLGKIPEGVALLDEAMVAVEAGDVSPIVIGDVYCSVIEGCQEIYDLRRAQEWTAALSRWCESQPDLVPYRGQCRVRRAEILQLHGAWSDALDEAERACDWLCRPPGQPAAGAAFYQKAELHRLRGELAEAEEAYRRASKWGRKPQPGLALLRLAQGRIDAAETAIRRVVDEAREPRVRSRVLPAQVEILVAGGDTPAARAAAQELSQIAADLDAPFVYAVSAHATGAVLLEEGDPRAGLDSLRRASAIWEELEAPYETARTRVLIAHACRALGDVDTAKLELDAAREIFQELGATPDVARLDSLGRRASPRKPHGLTPRELEVLRVVAAGATNKGIAARLSISERTVERHVSNIFVKLGVSSRSAATAYAYEHGLV